MRRKPKVIVQCVASQYECPDERIIEFNSKGGGGLISFYARCDGTLSVTLYRLDPTVIVGKTYFDPRVGRARRVPDAQQTQA